MSRRAAIRDRIMARVMIVPLEGNEHPCHLWTGPLSGEGRGGGYARMSLDGQTVAVHKVSWTNEHGFIPGKKQLDHLCPHRHCVNEKHLELVTQKVNCKRREKRKRLK